MPSKYIFFVAGPFHLICINEVIKNSKITDFDIYYLKKDNYLVNKQIYETYKFLKMSRMKDLIFSKFKFIQIFQLLLFTYKLKIISKKYDLNFFILDFRNSFLHFLRSIFINSPFILIDDGTSSFMNYSKYMEKKIFLPYEQYAGFYGKIKKYFLFRNKFRYLLYKEIDIFSIYANDLGLKNKNYNSLYFFKKALSKFKKKYDKSLVFFSGTKLSERGAISLNDELKLTMKINNYWKKKGKTMVYVAKRTSSKKKIEIFEKNSIKTISFDQPLEIALVMNNVFDIPSYFCSFGSTLDKTISLLYEKINIYLIEFSDINISRDLEEDLKLSKIMMKYIKNQKILKI